MSQRAIYKAILVIICLIFAKAQIDLPDGQHPLDVYFLADNTGSMGAEIAEVREQARFIFDDIAARATSNVRFGVGAYKDFGDNFVFKNLLSLTEENLEVPLEQDPIIKGMNLWEASGGGDEEEAQLYAMVKIARDQYEEIGWRSDAIKMLVWFGDAPGKDPASRINRVPVTEKFATDLLKQAEILVIALDVKNMNKSGQAKRIAEATGGKYVFVDRDRSQGQGSPSPIPTPMSPFPSPSPSPSASPSPSPSPCGSPVLSIKGIDSASDGESEDLWPTAPCSPYSPVLPPPGDVPHSQPKPYVEALKAVSIPIKEKSVEVQSVSAAPFKDRSVQVLSLEGPPPEEGLAAVISDEVSMLFTQAVGIP